MNETAARAEMATLSKRIWDQRWVANHDGNISLRLADERLLCTPTGESKRAISADMLLVVDTAGTVRKGRLRPFSELGLHLGWYRERPDIGAVLHAHPPVATAIGVAGRQLPHPFLPEAVVSLGASIPTVPVSMPGRQAEAAVAPYLRDHDVLLLAGNGVISCGADLEQAYLRMELVEHLCRIAESAERFGGVQKLPAHFLEPLLSARARSGLGAEGRAIKSDRQPKDDVNRDLTAIVQSEVDRVLS